MTPFINYLNYAFISLALLFVFYATLFTLLRLIRKYYLEDHWLVRPAFIVLVMVFIVADWWVNIVISFVFLDPPHSLSELVTTRMKRYKRKGATVFSTLIQRFRYRFALRLCGLLNQYDKDHC